MKSSINLGFPFAPRPPVGDSRSLMARSAQIHRKTAETDIRMELSVDGTGKSNIKTGVAFLDHMLTLFAKHGLFDLTVDAKGDIEVDFLHTVEDVGIVLGQCFREALGKKEGIRRYGWCLLPMDETLASVALDLSGRPLLVYTVPDRVDTIGIGFPFPTRGRVHARFCHHGRLANVHLDIVRGKDAHHMAEAMFKRIGQMHGSGHPGRSTGHGRLEHEGHAVKSWELWVMEL